jgi:adenine C2-methylase RlmN of 23S rRNA A2503 and tRNA A37
MNLFGLERRELEQAMLARGLPAFRGRQIYRALYARGIDSFEGIQKKTGVELQSLHQGP